MPIVKTTNGTRYTGSYPSPDNKDYEELTQEEAEALAQQANEKAEALGIDVRYEVTEA